MKDPRSETAKELESETLLVEVSAPQKEPGLVPQKAWHLARTKAQQMGRLLARRWALTKAHPMVHRLADPRGTPKARGMALAKEHCWAW